MTMSLYEISIVCAESDALSLSDVLEGLDALSVTVEDALAETEGEDALYAEPSMPAPKQAWQTSKISALFATMPLAENAKQALLDTSLCSSADAIGINEIQDQDWVRLTQSQFQPVEITPHFYIVPSWHEKPENADYAIALDPGLAFGTGSHPTTHLCLQWLASQNLKGKRILDYGCGSGILAIAAAMIGADVVVAVDIDAAAIEASQYNALKNNVHLTAGMPELAQEQRGDGYDIVVANILSNPLKVLAPLLCAMLREDKSVLLLSGILERQAQELQVIYAPYVELEVLAQKEGWILMCTK